MLLNLKVEEEEDDLQNGHNSKKNGDQSDEEIGPSLPKQNKVCCYSSLNFSLEKLNILYIRQMHLVHSYDIISFVVNVFWFMNIKHCIVL